MTLPDFSCLDGWTGGPLGSSTTWFKASTLQHKAKFVNMQRSKLSLDEVPITTLHMETVTSLCQHTQAYHWWSQIGKRQPLESSMIPPPRGPSYNMNWLNYLPTLLSFLAQRQNQRKPANPSQAPKALTSPTHAELLLWVGFGGSEKKKKKRAQPVLWYKWVFTNSQADTC